MTRFARRQGLAVRGRRADVDELEVEVDVGRGEEATEGLAAASAGADGGAGSDRMADDTAEADL